MGLMVKEREFHVHKVFTDSNDNVLPSGMLNLLQDIGFMHAEELGVGYEDMLANNMFWVVLYIKVEINKLPKRRDDVVIRTWPRPAGRLEFTREYEMKKDGNILARAISNWVAIDSISRRVVRGDKVHFNGEYTTETHFEEAQKRKIGLTLPDNYDTYIHKVRFTDTDNNGHMNNAKYLDVVSDMCKMNMGNLKSFEVAFIHELMLDEEITLKHFKDNDKDCFMGYKNDELCFEVVLELGE